MRAYSTAIYYLLQAGNFSALHRLSADEVWHHYQGGQVLIHVLSPQGEYSIMRLGTAGDPTESPQVQVPAGHWFGACPGKGVAYALMGCTVAPGFDFDDFELADRVRLSAQFPQHKSMIERFTR